MAANGHETPVAQERIQRILDDLVTGGRELGIQAAAYLNGRLIADAAAGCLDRPGGRKADRRSLFPIF